MTKRCRHEIETKDEVDLICQKCSTVWNLSAYNGWTARQLMALPKEVRFEVLRRQAEQFSFINPDYYKEGLK